MNKEKSIKMSSQQEIDIDTLPAGREFDILLAELITGQSRITCRIDPTEHGRNGEPQFHWGYPIGHDFAPNYTTDKNAAFQALGGLKQDYDYAAITGDPSAGYIVRLGLTNEQSADAGTLELAVARAVYKVLKLIKG